MPTYLRRIVLASTAPRERELFARLKLPFEPRPPAEDEEAERAAAAGLGAEDRARLLARRRAEGLAAACPDALIVAGAQVAELDGAPLDRPGSLEAAIERLLRLAGRTHRLIAAVAVHDAAGPRTEEALLAHDVRLRPISEAQAYAYAIRERPLDCAGAYRADGLGIALIESASGDDFTALLGLPLTRVVSLLERFRVSVLGPARR